MSWRIEELPHGTRNILDEQGLYVAEQRLGCQGSAEWRESKRARLNLAVAAPDLLEALELLVSKHVELIESGDCGYWDAEKTVEVQAARAAIAKAKG